MLCRKFSVPFDFYHFEQFCNEEEESEILQWLRALSDWKRVTTTFYDQYERHVANEELNSGVLSGLAQRSVDAVRANVFAQTSIKVSDKVDAGVIKIVPGQGIGVHTDHRPGRFDQEAYRLILHFCTRNLRGGELLLLSSARMSNVEAVVIPKSGDGVALSISNKSFHAVGDVSAGERYSLVMKCFLEPPPAR